MDDLIQELVEKTGISEDTAHQVIEMVIDHLKELLPQPIAAELDNLLGENADPDAGSDLKNDLGTRAKSALGNLFGKKQS